MSCLLFAPAGQARVEGQTTQRPQATAEQLRAAVEKSLTFLQNDVATWRKQRECSTCHHGTMTVWVYGEAQRRGYDIDAAIAAETLKWTKDRLLARIDLPRDPRPGWKMVSTPAVYLAVMAQCLPEQNTLSVDELKRIAGHLLRHQEDDGSWAWSSAPPQNRPPPVFESDEVVTRWACLALAPRMSADSKQSAVVRDGLQRAAVWLAKTPPSDTTQAAALRLLMKVRDGAPAEAVQSEINHFLSRQHDDGGFGQLDDLPSDAYATGQALYVLSLAGLKHDRPAVHRAVEFLIANQREDGSWPMKSRAHPGAKPYTNPVPITYFGSAWATLGLLRSQPHTIATAK